jgi:hypothetical protein
MHNVHNVRRVELRFCEGKSEDQPVETDADVKTGDAVGFAGFIPNPEKHWHELFTQVGK